jgi:hypothetical protein
MAFNPFVSFRKYQKFWMATLVLLSMVTFVLCTGLGQGGLEDRLLRLFGRSQGSPVAKLHGRDIYSQDLFDVKNQRNVANDFMRKFCEHLANKAEDNFKKGSEEKRGDDKNRDKILNQSLALKMEFHERLKKPRYFEGGIKLEDLVDFKLWVAEADRLGISLDNTSVRYLVDRELLYDYTHFDERDVHVVMSEVRRNHNFANDQYIYQALRDEFRVRMAQLALLSWHPDRFGPVARDRKGPDVRAQATPAQLWDYFKENRAEFDLALIPVEVKKFVEQVETPTEQELRSLFESYRKERYDPTSGKPGFEIPQQIKIEWVTADPQSPPYKKLAQLVAFAETHPLIYNPLVPPLLNALSYAATAPAEKTAYQTRYEVEASGGDRSPYKNVPLTSGNYLAGIVDFQARENPTALATLVGSLAEPLGPLTAPLAMRHVVYAKNEKSYQELIRAEAKKRERLFAGMVGLAADGILPMASLPLATSWYAASLKMETLPLEIVLPQYKEKYEKRLANRFVAHTMTELRKTLELSNVKGIEKGMENVLNKLAKTYSFQRNETANFYNRYTVQQAKELEPLRQAYLKYYVQINLFEGRGGTERNLRDTDFWKMFFDKSELFSTGLAKYTARPWPPAPTIKNLPLNLNPEDYKDAPPEALQAYMMRAQMAHFNPLATLPAVDLFADAEKPILFWKTKEKPSAYPEKLADVRERVEEAWKMLKAREKLALPKATEIATTLQGLSLNTDLTTEAKAEAKKLGSDVVMLRRVARLFAVFSDDITARKYSTFQLPRDTFLYPREDMVQQVLTFADATKPEALKPIQIENKDLKDYDVKELDKLNQKLLDDYKASQKEERGHPLVQVLTNQPRDAYYVAVMVKAPNADIRDFEESYKRSIGRPADDFVPRAYEGISQDFLQIQLKQLRERAGWWVTTDTDSRKTFDTDAAN